MEQTAFPVQSHMADYDSLYQSFSWADVEKELCLPRKTGYNKATICIDDHPPEVMQRTALIWEGIDGEIENYTFTDLKNRTNQIANLLQEIGMEKEDRLFIFLERVPELYSQNLLN